MRIAIGASMVAKRWVLVLLRYIFGKSYNAAVSKKGDMITQRNGIYVFKSLKCDFLKIEHLV
jgi:hypothetical protein